MDVPTWLWWSTIIAIALFLVVDVFFVGRSPHEPTLKECAWHLAFYVGLAVLFGLAVAKIWGHEYGLAYFAGWLTEYSLSVDNLFVFLVIMSRFAVPRQLQQSALLIGIVLALIMRGIFIAVGAAAISAFSWVFYIFGAFLVYTAVKIARQGTSGMEDFRENAVLRWVRRTLPATSS